MWGGRIAVPFSYPTARSAVHRTGVADRRGQGKPCPYVLRLAQGFAPRYECYRFLAQLRWRNSLLT